MKLDIINLKGSKVSDIAANANVFGIDPNNGVVRQAILSEMTNMRQGTHSSKNRANVKGGGKKPWKQKGRGVARAGTIRSPLWRGGGTVFGPEPHRYNHRLPKKLSRLARCSVLSSKAAEGNILVLENFAINSHKTSEFVSVLETLNLKNKKLTLLITEYNENLDKSVRNLRNVNLVEAKKVSTYDLIDCDVLLSDKASIEILNDLFNQ